jgi:hypothetical protein
MSACRNRRLVPVWGGMATSLSQESQDISSKLPCCSQDIFQLWLASQHFRLVKTVGRYGLDPDSADIVASDAGARWLRAVGRRMSAGSQGEPERWAPLLYGTCLHHAALDVIRRRCRDRTRLLPLESDAACPRESRPLRAPCDALYDPYRATLAAWCTDRLSTFFIQLLNGELGQCYRDLLDVAAGFDCCSPIEQYLFLSEYFSEAALDSSVPTRAGVHRLLPWFSNRAAEKRYVPIFRLRLRLAERWRHLNNDIFREPSLAPSRNQYRGSLQRE